MTTDTSQRLPVIIKGGMGFAISTPLLASAVSKHGGLGTVSGVSLERVLALKLGNGDEGGHCRRALSHFPFPKKSKMVLDAFLRSKSSRLSPRGIPFFSVEPSPLLIALTVCANYVFVWLAKEGHRHPISINYLAKIDIPLIYAITGAMMAGVDYITVGAGIPLHIHEVIDALMERRIATYNIPIIGSKEPYKMCFDPKAFFGGDLHIPRKPRFLPIVASNTLASRLASRLPKGSIFGFVIEGPTAGGHNAPPRGKVVLNSDGEPIYGPKDVVDYEEIRKLGYPFWIAGSMCSPEKLAEALAVGAHGIQVGSAFAFCDESGMDPELKKLILKLALEGKLQVKTDPLASPTSYPFKVGQINGTLSEREVYESRERSCDHGVLQTPYLKPDGSIGYRCPAEPITAYLSKGGKLEDTAGRQCICNGLMATAGLGDPSAKRIVTLGDDAIRIAKTLKRPTDEFYSALDVFKYLGQSV